MERHGADLERDPGKHEHQAEKQAERRLAAGECRRNAVEVHRAREAIQQRDSIKQDAARECAEHEIFETGLRRAVVRPSVGREHIGSEALELEADVERDQAGRGNHDRSAQRREQDQHRIFGSMLRLALEPAVRGNDRHRRREKNDRLPECSEQIGGDQTAEQAAGIGRGARERNSGGNQHGDRRPARKADDAASTPGRDHHQDHAANDEDQLGQYGCELVHQ